MPRSANFFDFACGGGVRFWLANVGGLNHSTKKVNVKYFLFSSVQHGSMFGEKKKGLISHMPLSNY